MSDKWFCYPSWLMIGYGNVGIGLWFGLGWDLRGRRFEYWTRYMVGPIYVLVWHD